jgi:hypothetical protein
LKELRAKVHPTSGPLILFIQTLQGLQQFIPDEITRFRAAAQTLAGHRMNGPGAAILSSTRSATPAINWRCLPLPDGSRKIVLDI